MFRFECSSGPSNEFSLHLTCLLPPCSYVDVNAAALGESAGDALGDDGGGSGEQSRSTPTPAPIATPRAVQSGPLRAASQQVRGLASLLHRRRRPTAAAHPQRRPISMYRMLPAAETAMQSAPTSMSLSWIKCRAKVTRSRQEDLCSFDDVIQCLSLRPAFEHFKFLPSAAMPLPCELS